jgi:mannose-1-phosphate guanylyltransferase
VSDKATFVAYIYRGYWIDIGTPEKYRRAHHDIMDGRFPARPFLDKAGQALVSREARVEAGAVIEGPCFIDAGAVVKAGARIGPYSVIGSHCHIGEGAVVEQAILWPNKWVDADSRVVGTITGRHCHLGRNVTVSDGSLLGDKSVVTDYSRI